MSDVFARRLRAYRKLKHWTQAELAAAAGVSVAIIGGLERGTRAPTPALVQRLTEILHVTEAELLGASPQVGGAMVSGAEAPQRGDDKGGDRGAGDGSSGDRRRKPDKSG
ncbi:helix-turn-helix domain-containing protein [Alicyclobacillus macrosporangiidus]|uniref:helix-turn-helix domain-containing protein n=1 Tax=Alicyclobacillus macrosporangiidus TaxID=392015 RepID=UPI0009DDAF02|nr:helix-turn-helix transcriptional regulator [Alicyclobacillus macrosporangiidus]